MDFDSIKILINSLNDKLKQIEQALNLNLKKERIEELEKRTLEEGFWEEQQLSSSVLTELKILKDLCEKVEKLNEQISDATLYIELAEEMNDIESFKEAKNICNTLEEKLEKLEIDTLLSGKYDKNNAILTIHPGAGGTESQDWALMLYRMYTKWASKTEFEIEVLDLQDGEEAGIKSVSFLVKGINSYGYLKCENGVHRLVRISPFDSNSRRHTSFAAVEVLPEISDDITVE